MKIIIGFSRVALLWLSIVAANYFIFKLIMILVGFLGAVADFRPFGTNQGHEPVLVRIDNWLTPDTMPFTDIWLGGLDYSLLMCAASAIAFVCLFIGLSKLGQIRAEAEQSIFDLAYNATMRIVYFELKFVGGPLALMGIFTGLSWFLFLCTILLILFFGLMTHG